MIVETQNAVFRYDNVSRPRVHTTSSLFEPCQVSHASISPSGISSAFVVAS
jgi:hypothetical protein